MGFADELARAACVWFGEDLAQAVTYNGAAIRGHVEHGAAADHPSGAVGARATLMVRRADVPAPAYRDTAVIGGAAWRVLSVESGDDLTWTLNISKDERPVR